jgi:c(7)-type cytochrome triheme protein
MKTLRQIDFRQAVILALGVIALTMAMGLQMSEAEDMVGGGEIVFTEPVKAVLFSHKYHVEEAGFDCESCHDGIFAYETGAAERAGDFTMQSLYDGKYCGACHTEGGAFASNEQCARCHVGVKGWRAATGQADQPARH